MPEQELNFLERTVLSVLSLDIWLSQTAVIGAVLAGRVTEGEKELLLVALNSLSRKGLVDYRFKGAGELLSVEWRRVKGD